MAEEFEFYVPGFLIEDDETVLQRMLDTLPDTLDKSRGQCAYDFLKPTALEKARFIEENLMRAIQAIFAKYCQNDYELMNLHAESRGLSRLAAIAATGEVKVSGKPGTIIPKGYLFCTPSVDGSHVVEFATTSDAVITEDYVLINVICTEAGAIGNVPAGAIELMASSPINGVIAITNDTPTTGGTDEENNEHLYERIAQFDRSLDVSFVGSMADYIRWAKEVDGVGEVVVIPAQDTSGLVTIIVTDLEGNPADFDLCEAVYNHIMRPDSPKERLAPINDIILLVIPAEVAACTISATVELLTGYTIESVTTAFTTLLQSYFSQIGNEENEENEIKYTMIGRLLSQTEGVNDYKNLKLNDDTANIPIAKTQVVSLKESTITLSTGTV